MFKEGQFVRNKNTGAIYLLLQGKRNKPENGAFDFTTVEKGTTTFSQPIGIIQEGSFYSPSYEVVELVEDSFKPVMVEKFYKIGDKFRYKDGTSTDTFVLVTSSTTCINLVNIEDGTRFYLNGKPVSNWNKITEQELKDVLKIYERIED